MKKEIFKQFIETILIALNIGYSVLTIAKYIKKYLATYGDN